MNFTLTTRIVNALNKSIPVKEMSDFKTSPVRTFKKIVKESELSPCPFCGTEPEWINETLPDGHYYIRCPHCHIVMKEDRRDKAKGMWNRREEIKDLQAEVERLEQWKREQIEVTTPLFEFMQGPDGTRLGLKPGDSIISKTIELLKSKL
jgi:hypothetical protein